MSSEEVQQKIDEQVYSLAVWRRNDAITSDQLREEILRLYRDQGEVDVSVGDLAEARMWARHGYELGQRFGYWTDPGTAPEWLTES